MTVTKPHWGGLGKGRTKNKCAKGRACSRILRRVNHGMMTRRDNTEPGASLQQANEFDF